MLSQGLFDVLAALPDVSRLALFAVQGGGHEMRRHATEPRMIYENYRDAALAARSRWTRTGRMCIWWTSNAR